MRDKQWSSPPPADVGDDAQRLRAARHDLTLFGPVYERYVDRIYAYCRYRVGDADAEDVTSQVFVQAMVGIAGFRGGSVAAWLFRIAHNCVVDHLRYRRPQVSLDEHAIEIPADSADPLDRVAEADQLDMLKTIIATLLDDGQITLLTLRLTSGLTSGEIGEVVGKSAVAVRVEISRIMRRVRARYREMMQEADS
jgi:RNA polymerase sigma-70 factor (ECF subfamily)